MKEITTPPAAVARADAPLAELAGRINDAHRDALAAARTSLEYARKAGTLLLEAKARLPHGQFMAWVDVNCPFKRSTANNYMRVAREWDSLSLDGEPATIAGALQQLGPPEEEEANYQPAGNSPQPYDWPVHPALAAFPEFTGYGYEQFRESIRVHGQLHPVAIWQGQLLDGRARLRACRELGIAPLVHELPPETDPTAYVMSMNGGARRNLTRSQQAAAIVKAEDLMAKLHGKPSGAGEDEFDGKADRIRDVYAKLGGDPDKFLVDDDIDDDADDDDLPGREGAEGG